MTKKPKVSIVTVTYNQEKYVAQALESFVAQKTDFDIEIVVSDDASTDKTPKIIRTFAKSYPDIFKVIFRDKNVGVAENFYGAMRKANGKYIALCEGDDYWTDSQKLQRQVNFLDENPNYALCFHPVRVFFEDATSSDYTHPKGDKDQSFSLERLLKENYIQTNSVMYRTQDYKNLPTDIMPVDWYLHLYHAQFGNIGYINTVMSAYRRHAGGIWWDSYKNINKIWEKHGLSHLTLYIEIQKLFSKKPQYKNIINPHINNMFNALAATDKKNKSDLIRQAIVKFPDNAESFIDSQYRRIEQMEMFLHQKNVDMETEQKEMKRLQQDINDRDLIINQLRQEITTIKASRIWKSRNKIAKIVGKEEV